MDEEVGKIFVTMEARGDLAKQVEEGRRAAEDEAKRRPITLSTSIEQIAEATGENPADIASAFGVRSASRAAATVVSKERSPADVTRPASRDEMLRAFGPPRSVLDALSRETERGATPTEAAAAKAAYADKDREARLAIGRADAASERGATPDQAAAVRKLLDLPSLAEETRLRSDGNRQASQFNRYVETAGRGLDRLARSTVGVGVGGEAASAMAGGAPLAAAVAGLAAGIEAMKRFVATTQSTVALYSPGRAYQLERAQMDLQASLGRGLLHEHDRLQAATRGAADYLADHPKQVEAAGATISTGLGLSTLEGALEWLGSGSKGKSRDMAIHPELGRTFGGALEYDRSLQQALSQQTSRQDEPSEKMSKAADKFDDAVEKLRQRDPTIPNPGVTRAGMLGVLDAILR